jgi:hypothetical protein
MPRLKVTLGEKLKVTLGEKARCYRRACNLPAPPQLLAASCHIAGVPKYAASKRNNFSHKAVSPSRIPLARFAFALLSVDRFVSL